MNMHDKFGFDMRVKCFKEEDCKKRTTGKVLNSLLLQRNLQFLEVIICKVIRLKTSTGQLV